jgi:hypothetical protein
MDRYFPKPLSLQFTEDNSPPEEDVAVSPLGLPVFSFADVSYLVKHNRVLYPEEAPRHAVTMTLVFTEYTIVDNVLFNLRSSKGYAMWR